MTSSNNENAIATTTTNHNNQDESSAYATALLRSLQFSGVKFLRYATLDASNNLRVKVKLVDQLLKQPNVSLNYQVSIAEVAMPSPRGLALVPGWPLLCAFMGDKKLGTKQLVQALGPRHPQGDLAPTCGRLAMVPSMRCAKGRSTPGTPPMGGHTIRIIGWLPLGTMLRAS